MRNIFILGWIVILSCLACNKPQNTCTSNLQEGRIIGYDFRKCACCGGFWTEVGTDTLRSFTLPENVEIADTTFIGDLDVPVCLSYEVAEDCNLTGELIEVSEMVLQ